MKLKTSFKVVFVLCILFAFASLFLVYRITTLEDKNKELQQKIESFMSNETAQEKACTQEPTVIYDVDSLEQHLDQAAEKIIIQES